MKRTTIFKQLILNVVIPVIITLVLMAGLNIGTSLKTLKKENIAKKQIIYDEIESILGLQDMALEILEDELGVPPAAETITLFEAIRTNQVAELRDDKVTRWQGDQVIMLTKE